MRNGFSIDLNTGVNRSNEEVPRERIVYPQVWMWAPQERIALMCLSSSQTQDFNVSLLNRFLTDFFLPCPLFPLSVNKNQRVVPGVPWIRLQCEKLATMVVGRGKWVSDLSL